MLPSLMGAGSPYEVGVKAAPPYRVSVVKSASVFTEIVVPNIGLLVPLAPDGSNVFFRQTRDPGNAITNQEYLQAVGGVCPLPASGSWWVNVQTNIAAGTYAFLLVDFPTTQEMYAMMKALTLTQGTENARVANAAASATVTGVSSVIIAANTLRTAISITHTGTTDGAIATNSVVDLGFGANAVANTGLRVFPKQTVPWDVLDGIVLQGINGISSSGSVFFGIQEWQ
jgi:hypothetical protein